MKSMETKVNVTFTITKREGETDAATRERLLSLIDSELCHLVDHDIRAEAANTINVQEEILSRLNQIRMDVSKDVIGFDVQQRLSGILAYIQNAVSGFNTICDAELTGNSGEKTYVTLVEELRSLIELLDRRIDPQKWDLINARLDKAAQILWQYSY